jgi:hypothetical protein
MPRLSQPTAAIDPGKTGAVAVDCFPTPKVFPCPQDEASLLDLLRRENVGKVVVENVGQARAGNGLVSAVKFARHCQLLQSTLRTAGFEIVLIAPSKWIPAFLGADKPPFPISLHAYAALDIKGRNKVDAKYKAIRKKRILQKVLDKTKMIGVPLAHADAIALLLYYKENL